MVRNSLSKSIYKSSKEFSIWQFDHTIFKIRRLEVDPVVLARDLDEVQTSSWKFWKTFFWECVLYTYGQIKLLT